MGGRFKTWKPDHAVSEKEARRLQQENEERLRRLQKSGQ